MFKNFGMKMNFEVAAYTEHQDFENLKHRTLVEEYNLC